MSSSSPPMSPKDLNFVISTGIHQGLSQIALLQHWLRLSAIPFDPSAAKAALRDAIIVGLDAEWWEHDSSYITELGVSILDPRFISDWDSPWTVLQSMVTQHVRIKPNAHLMNSELCRGFPDNFEFGKTSFVDMEQAKEMLRCSFLRFDNHGRPRPVIFIGHAVDNDAKIIKERFGLDIEALGVVVATIDTQVLAAGTGLAHGPRKIKLCDLLAKYNICELYLHNGGNDIVCTMVAAFLMSSPFSPQSHSQAYHNLKTHLRTNSKVMYGSQIYCLKCDSDNHTADYCRLSVYCKHCSSSIKTVVIAPDHKTEKCLVAIKKAVKAMREPSGEWSAAPRYPFPCSLCIESTDPKRHTLDYAYDHLEKDCVFKAGGSEGVVNPK